MGAGQLEQIWTLVSACGSLAKQNSSSHCSHADVALFPCILAPLWPHHLSLHSLIFLAVQLRVIKS